MSEMIVPLIVVVAAAAALPIAVHLGERKVDAQSRSSGPAALGCFLAVMAGMLGAFLGVLLWSLSRWPQ